ncbi:Uncharacterised protein [Yersinia pekkanenii]|uniref:Uncharacterized protein n=1 Tax=Yersinia pekkanenii TaxID=1288385 RepID=A0A0T9QI29_9GAMM|nr:Uncharacterised protein [Yersinia pekkanenii]CRY69212.1 Uncharacterised protein [Yersinia pekkanenii]
MKKLQPRGTSKKTSPTPEAELTPSFIFKNLLGYEMRFLTVEESGFHRRYYSDHQSNPE